MGKVYGEEKNILYWADLSSQDRTQKAQRINQERTPFICPHSPRFQRHLFSLSENAYIVLVLVLVLVHFDATVPA
jgi:hypothetical protein